MEKFNIGDRVYTSLVKYGHNNKGTITNIKNYFFYFLYEIKLDNGKIISVPLAYVYKYLDEAKK